MLLNPNFTFISVFCISVSFKSLTFVGVPVTTTFFALGNLNFASSNPVKTKSTFFDNSFIVTPGNALLSCKTVGIFSLVAAVNTGPHIYPPVPITKSGL